MCDDVSSSEEFPKAGAEIKLTLKINVTSFLC